MRLRNGELTVDDWKVLMKRTPAMVKNVTTFEHALHLFPAAAMVADYNTTKLRANTQPVAAIEAIHSGPSASKIPASDAGGLEPIVYLTHGANLWALVNGAMGTGKWSYGHHCGYLL